MEKNTFSVEEVREILSKGLSYQNASDDALLQIETKLSLDELKRHASDVGISPRHLQEAIEQQKNRIRVFRNDDFMGSPNHVVINSSMKGELDDSGIVEIVKRLRQYFNLIGTFEKVGKHFSWSAALGDQASLHFKEPGIDVYFEGKSTNGSTELKMTYSPTSLKYRSYVGATFVPLFLFPLFLSQLRPEGASIYLLLVSLIIGFNLIAYFGFKKFFKYRSRKIFDHYKELKELAETFIESDENDVDNRIDLDRAEGYQSGKEKLNSPDKNRNLE